MLNEREDKGADSPAFEQLFEGGFATPEEPTAAIRWSPEKHLAAAVLTDALIEVRDFAEHPGHKKQVAEDLADQLLDLAPDERDADLDVGVHGLDRPVALGAQGDDAADEEGNQRDDRHRLEAGPVDVEDDRREAEAGGMDNGARQAADHAAEDSERLDEVVPGIDRRAAQ